MNQKLEDHFRKTRIAQPWTFRATSLAAVIGAMVVLACSAPAQSFFFSTGGPDGLMATASRPGSSGITEIESADDFLLSTPVSLNQGTFTGLLPSGAALSDVASVSIEIYRVFPNDSTQPPSGNVPTRVNSPSDVAFGSRDSIASTLTYNASVLGSFSAANSVLNGIHPKPGNITGGDGAITGEEVKFNLTFNPLDLPADHYFFVPQVQLNNGDFYWLSAPKPIVQPGTSFTPDLQTWIRNGDLDPDWLRVGTDIVGGNTPPTFNASFSLSGTVPDATSTGALLVIAFGALASCATRLRRR
jgi:hypothetical protein